MFQLSFFETNYRKTLLKLALPLILNQFIFSILQMIDVILVGQLGEESVAAVAVAGQVWFVLSLMYFGFNSGSAVFSAQFWGKKDIGGIRNILLINVLINICLGLVVTFLATTFPRQIISLFTSDPEVISLGSGYLAIHARGFIFTGISWAVYATLRSMEEVRLPMITSILALCFSTGMGYLLIFGKLGLPQMGVEGAATANSTARILESISILFIFYLSKNPARLLPGTLLPIAAGLPARYLKIALPVGINEVIWSLGVATYNLVYSRIGTESIAAINISTTLENMAFVILIGISNACAIMIGNKIGSGRIEDAKFFARATLMLTVVTGLVLGIAVFLLRTTFLKFYRVSESTLDNAFLILTVLSFVLWIKGVNLASFIGLMRAGGDTRWALFVEMGTMWLYGVPLAFLSAFVFHLPVYYVLMFVVSEEVLKAVLVFRRYRSGKWIHEVAESAEVTEFSSI